MQAVTSALPVDLHIGCYLDVLKAGKDLYAEKPMCLTLAECDTLIAAARAARDRIVQIGFQRRSDPKFLEAMALVHAGELGRLVEGRGFPFTGQEFPSEELLGKFVDLFYDANVIPDEVLLPFELEDAQTRQEWLTEKRGKKLTIKAPMQGEKLALVEMSPHSLLAT